MVVSYRQHGPTQVVKLDDGHGEGDGHQRDDQVLHIWKRRKRKKWDQGKGIMIGAIFGLHSRHHRGCEWFRIDS